MYTLPDLPYEYDALEPHIDAKTMEIHHQKHHATYVQKLSDALKDQPELQKPGIESLLQKLDEVSEESRTAVRNNGGGHANHSLFWTLMSPDGGGEPQGELAEQINNDFGSFAEFQDKFANSCVSRFGSGWAWVIYEDGKLQITSTPNQDTPLMDGVQPVLGLDVWEHAYYLKHQNKRPDYVKAWWNVVNWREVERRFADSR